MKLLNIFLFILLINFSFSCQKRETRQEKPLSISKSQAQEIGALIWKNECGGKVEQLVFWNENEAFPSLGIAHFIWPPKNQSTVFRSLFPELLQYISQQRVHVPTWLRQPHCPWENRQAFLKDSNSPRMKELKKFLIQTIPHQASFIAIRLEKTLPKITKNLPPQEKLHVTKQFYRVAHQTNGIYALIDYVNFKGEGSSTSEQYNGEGWGLLQVLKNMKDTKEDPMISFIRSAKQTLKKRVKNAPKNSHEERWIKGWFKRIDTYGSL